MAPDEIAQPNGFVAHVRSRPTVAILGDLLWQ